MAHVFRVDGIDHEPDDALGREFPLQILRRTGRILIVTKRAVGIIGLDDDDLALVIAQFDGLAGDVRAGEIRRGLANLDGHDRERRNQCGKQCQCFFHKFKVSFV